MQSHDRSPNVATDHKHKTTLCALNMLKHFFVIAILFTVLMGYLCADRCHLESLH